MIKIIGNWTKVYWDFKLIGDSRWPGPRSYSPGNTVTHSRLQVGFNITRDNSPFTTNREVLSHFYTHIYSCRSDCNACLSHSTGLSPVYLSLWLPFTGSELASFFMHLKTPFLTCHYNADTVTIEV